jgi:imidazolonepropionase-like amidohydrolase
MSVVLRASRLLLSSTVDIIEDGAVIIQGDRILRAGSWTGLKDVVPMSAEIKDLGDVTLMPGLFDCHVTNPYLCTRTIFNVDSGTSHDGSFVNGWHYRAKYE